MKQDRWKCKTAGYYIFSGAITILSFFFLYGNHVFAYQEGEMEPLPASDFLYDNYSGEQEDSEDTIIIDGYLGDEKKVVIPSEIEGKRVYAIDRTLFLGKGETIEEVYFPDTVKLGTPRMFEDCTALKKVDLGSLQYSFDFRGFANLFWSCRNLEFLKMSDEAHLDLECNSYGNFSLFAGSRVDSLKYIYIGDNIDQLSLELFYGENLQWIDIGENNPLYKSVDGVVYSADGKQIYVCGTAYPYDYYEIPEGVETIDHVGFEECSNIKKIKFPASLKSVSSPSCTDKVSVLEVRKNSYGEFYARQNGYSIEYYGNPVAEQDKIDIFSYAAQAKLSQAAYTYDGTPKCPDVNIEGLEKDVDYRLRYDNNLNPGTASVAVSGINCFTGKIRLEFTILPKQEDDSTSSTQQPYPGGNGGGIDQPSQGGSTGSTEQPFPGGNGGGIDQPSQGGSTGSTQQPPQGGNGSSANQPFQGGNGNNTEQPSQGGNGNNADKPSTDPSDPALAPKKGTKLTDTKTKASYTVTKQGTAVAYAGTTNKNATSVTIPAAVKVGNTTYKVTSIAANAFKNNKKLKKATISGNVASIGANAFSGATSLTTVKMGTKVTAIGDKAFYGCKKLSSVTMGKNTASIGKSAFENCTAMKKATIPAKVKKVGSRAFYNCKKLSLITIQSKSLTAKDVGSKAFTKAGNGKKLTVKVPKSKFAAYKKLLKKKGLFSKAKVKKG